MVPVFSPKNPLSLERFVKLEPFRASGLRLCAGAWAARTPGAAQYDCLCALAAALYDANGDDPIGAAIQRAQDEVVASTYSRGFQRGWDCAPRTTADEVDPANEFGAGYRDGFVARVLMRALAASGPGAQCELVPDGTVRLVR